MTIEEAFGIAVKTRRTITGKTELIPPPPAVLRVLGDQAHRLEARPTGHGPKTQKRRLKRRRLNARARMLQRTTWRRYHEDLKRLEKEQT
jgi:hypothetical protein